MCPHGYHHNGFMATPALGTQEVRFIYIYIHVNCIRLFREVNFTKQPVDQHRLINLYNLHV